MYLFCFFLFCIAKFFFVLFCFFEKKTSLSKSGIFSSYDHFFSIILDVEIVLRVRFPALDGRVTTMRFGSAQSVLDTKRQILAKLAEESRERSTGNADSDCSQYGLFQPYGAFTQPRWLNDERSLSFYDLRPGLILFFC